MAQENQPGSDKEQQTQGDARQSDANKGFAETNLDRDEDLDRGDEEQEDDSWLADGSDGGAASDGGDA